MWYFVRTRAYFVWQKPHRTAGNDIRTVFLLDVGLNKHTAWMDLHLLDEKWCHQKPFANCCALISVASANPIDHVTWHQQQQFEKRYKRTEFSHVCQSTRKIRRIFYCITNWTMNFDVSIRFFPVAFIHRR